MHIRQEARNIVSPSAAHQFNGFLSLEQSQGQYIPKDQFLRHGRGRELDSKASHASSWIGHSPIEHKVASDCSVILNRAGVVIQGVNVHPCWRRARVRFLSPVSIIRVSSPPNPPSSTSHRPSSCRSKTSIFLFACPADLPLGRPQSRGMDSAIIQGQ